MNKGVNIYDERAEYFAQKWDLIGPRIADINKAFNLLNKKQPRVLELGCGNGRDAVEILKRTSSYIGIDVSPRLIKIAKAKCPGADFRVLDFHFLDLPTSSVDIIFSFASLIHTDKYKFKDLLQKAHGWLSDDGIFYISLKMGAYEKYQINDEAGSREHFFYQQEDVQELSKNLYETLKTDTQELRNQSWLTIILRKKQS